MGAIVGDETERPREALDVGKVYGAVLLLIPDGPGRLDPLMAPVAAVEEKPPELEGGVAVWVTLCVTVKVEGLLNVDADVEVVSPRERVEIDTEILLLKADVGDEEPPPVTDRPVVDNIRGVVVVIDGVLVLLSSVAILLEFQYGPVELAEAELAPPVDRMMELLEDIPFEVLTGLTEVTVLLEFTEIAELRVRIDVTVELHSLPRPPHSGLEVMLEIADGEDEDEDAGAVTDHPVVAHIRASWCWDIMLPMS